jgi:ATPase subunit of ABC transporter with duplicated ATPase domains
MEFIFTVEGLRKLHGQRVILDGITLAFLPGAKIGVIGSNGSGKSTLLRILAGEDKAYEGSARPADGIRIGYLPQEPRLDPGKDVRGNLEEAVAPTRALLAKHDELNARTRCRRCSTSWGACSPRSRRATHGNSTASWRRRCTRSSCRRPTRA